MTQSKTDETVLSRGKANARSGQPASGEVGSSFNDIKPPFDGLFGHRPPFDSFPGYEIVREISRGAQGVVYMAIQKGTKKKVALKVMREGPFAGPLDRARFEREVLILGQLSHPNIVTVHDTGDLNGNFFYAMDYIPGQPLDSFMAEKERGIDETLRVFGKICEAVNAAHLRGVIHRDLKPSNIRVDSDGEPHLLDFGVAKVSIAVGDATTPPVATVTGQFIGSLPWASPEQAEGNPDRVDIRTDVYSLGVILYQMLTGEFPYKVIGSMREVLDNILKAEPARPSSVRRKINDDVETIVLKCLSKDRQRRYQTAGEVARDVGHYLAGRPIDAKRDSAFYVIRKTLMRYKTVTAVSVGYVLLITTSAVGLGMMNGKLGHERDQARNASRRASVYSGLVESIITKAEFGGSRDANGTEGLDPTLFFAQLDDVAAEIQPTLAEWPDEQAKMHDTLAKAYMFWGRYDPAKEHFEAARQIREQEFGDVHPDFATSLHNLGWWLKENGDYKSAEEHYQKALHLRRKWLGPEHLEVADTLNNYGQLLADIDQCERAEPMFHEALMIREKNLGEVHRDVATSLANLGACLGLLERYDEAEPFLRDALALRRKLFGSDHAHTVVSMNRLAVMLKHMKCYDEAEALYREALAARLKIYPAKHRMVAVSLHNLGTLLHKRGKLDEAEILIRDALNTWRETIGNEHCDVGAGLKSLASLLIDRMEYQEAEPLLHEALAIFQKKNPNPKASRMAIVKSLLAACLTNRSAYIDAEPLLTDGYNALMEKFGGDNEDTRQALERVIELYDLWGKRAEAEAYEAMRTPVEKTSTNRCAS